MLEFKQVSKSFRDGNQMIQAVKPTDLKIIQGELIAIVGPSGSGKSTFLTMAGALQRPTSGIFTSITKIYQYYLKNSYLK